MITTIRTFVTDESGATAIEYGLDCRTDFRGGDCRNGQHG